MFVFSSLANAQVPPPAPTSTAPQAIAVQPLKSPRPPGGEWAEVEKRLAAIEALGDSASKRLATIEKILADAKGPSLLATFLPAVIAALAAVAGVLLGGYVNERLQRTRLEQEMTIARDKAEHEKNLAAAEAQQERELSEKQAKLQIGSAVVEWQLKQLSLFYGPMRALLGQSFGLYRQMNRALERADSDHFRFASVGADVDGQQFQIQMSPGKWERFRTVMRISEVYGKGFGVETYFDEIVSIGARIVTIIEQHAGYARPEEKDLMAVFAKYLAHFAVLKHLHDEAKAKLAAGKAVGTHADAVSAPSVLSTKVDLSAAFPENLHTLINDGFEAITKDIETWRRKAEA